MKKLILISNDDGYQAQGISVLKRLMSKLGDVIVVAPDSARSGAACSITATSPVTLRKIEEGVFACSGTPVDSVKIALEKVLPRRPDLLVSGINHGDNISISVHYSGTMGVCMEGCSKGIPSIGFSLRTLSKECDFTPYEDAILQVAEKVLQEGLPQDVCLNVNFPELGTSRNPLANPYSGDELRGIRYCRQSRGTWEQEWNELEPEGDKRRFSLTGRFVNLEPQATDTDCWALDNGFASVVPTSLNMTAR